jgi:hypothetical protein
VPCDENRGLGLSPDVHSPNPCQQGRTPCNVKGSGQFEEPVAAPLAKPFGRVPAGRAAGMRHAPLSAAAKPGHFGASGECCA